MPLGANVVNVANQAAADLVDGVVVQDAVVPLVTDGQNLVRRSRDPAHLLALGDAVGHQLLGQHMLALAHGVDRRRVVQVERHRDDHRLDVEIRIIEQRLVVAFFSFKDLHVLAGFVFRLPTVNLHQPFARGMGAGRFPIAVKRAIDAVRPNVGDRADVDVVGIQRPDQHAPFVARAQDGDAQPVVDLRPIAEVHRPHAHAGSRPGEHRPLEEVAARRANGFVEVVFADLFFFGREIHGDIAYGRRVESIVDIVRPGKESISEIVEAEPAAGASSRKDQERGELDDLVVSRRSIRDPRRLRRDDGEQEQCAGQRRQSRKEAEQQASADADRQNRDADIEPIELSLAADS